MVALRLCVDVYLGLYLYLTAFSYIISFKRRLGKLILKWLIILKLIVPSVVHGLPLLTVWMEWMYTPQFYM